MKVFNAKCVGFYQKNAFLFLLISGESLKCDGKYGFLLVNNMSIKVMGEMSESKDKNVLENMSRHEHFDKN